MQEISFLFSLGLSDTMIARRLGVSRMTVNRWRRQADAPRADSRIRAKRYLEEVSTALQGVTNCNAL